MRRVEQVGWLAAFVAGGLIEIRYGAGGRPELMDLAVGWMLLGSALSARIRAPSYGFGWLVAATAIGWFGGTIDPSLVFAHRGPFVHTLVAYPGARVRDRLGQVAVGAGYVIAFVPRVWSSARWSLTLAALLVLVALLRRTPDHGRLRRSRTLARRATTAWSVALLAGAVLQLSLPDGASDSLLFGYEAVLVSICVWLVLGVLTFTRQQTDVTDLVVELGESRSGALRDALAAALGDSALEVGYRQGGAYVDDSGRPVVLPTAESARMSTPILVGTEPIAVLVHDRSLAADDGFGGALASAKRLVEHNARLQQEVRSSIAELTASRRRMVAAADDERLRLETALHVGAERRLAGVLATLAALDHGLCEEIKVHVRAAETQLSQALGELHDLARGLHPRMLSERGLSDALTELGRSAHPAVTIGRVPEMRLTEELTATVWFCCTECIANAVKHAGCENVRVDFTLSGGDLLLVCVADDGVGGADAGRGTGLRGLADRVEALGGRLSVRSPIGHGTTVTAALRVSADLEPDLAAPHHSGEWVLPHLAEPQT
jgi:signal transduction histidine kinase